VKENDTEKLSNSVFLNVITSSLSVIFPKIIPRGVARFFQFRVEWPPELISHHLTPLPSGLCQIILLHDRYTCVCVCACEQLAQNRNVQYRNTSTSPHSNC